METEDDLLKREVDLMKFYSVRLLFCPISRHEIFAFGIVKSVG